jgi:hypothetical protein
MRSNVRAIYAWLGSLVLLGGTPPLALALIGQATTASRLAGVLIGVLGAVPWMLVVATMLRKSDEYARRIHLIAFGLAFAGMLVALSAIGWLVQAKFIAPPDFMLLWAAALVLWLICFVIAKRHFERVS